MNFKTTAIALAVAGTVATPMAAQADLYASARIGLINTSTDSFGGATSIDDTQIRGLGSRFGVRSETDLGNGLTGFGRYEWSVNVDDTSATTIGLRHGYVGLKGDFGSVTLGRTYHTYYNHVVGPADNPWWGAGYTWLGYTGRTSNALTYAGSTGAVSFGATLYMFSDDDPATPLVDEGDALDGSELAASFGVGDMTLGVGYKDEDLMDDPATSADESDPIIGLMLSGIPAGDIGLAIGFTTTDAADGYVIDAGIGNAYVHYEATSIDADALAATAKADVSTLTLGYTQSLGRKTTAWYEFQTTDNDMTAADFDIIRAMLKYDIE